MSSRRFSSCRYEEGFRWNDGIPQDNSQHGRLYFVELHGYF